MCASIVPPCEMKGSPCCAGLMRSCLHTYRTKTNLTHQLTMGGPSAKYGGVISQVWGGHQPTMGGPSTDYGGAISQVWGGHQPIMGGHQPTMGGHQPSMGGGHQPTMGGPSTNYGGGGIFPPVCTGSQNPQNYFSNKYVLPSVNRTAGPMKVRFAAIDSLHASEIDVNRHHSFFHYIPHFCS